MSAAEPARERGGGAPIEIRLPGSARRLVLTDRACWGVLGVAMAISTALILWLNRGTTFSIDQYDFVEDSPAVGLGDLLDPHNGHLVATTRLAYKAILETAGIDFLAFRLLGVLALLLAVGVFYALIRRRVGAVAALAPAILLLFFGSAWHHVIVPVGFTSLLSIATGLGALLALERSDRRGDAVACGLLLVSVASYTTSLAFVAGAAIWLAFGADRWRRAWIVAVPVALYALWWLFGPPDTGAPPEAKLSNLLLIPSYAAESLAAVIAALTGLGYDFSNPTLGRELGWGQALAVVAVAALVLRVRRTGMRPAIWVGLVILLVYWGLLALSVDPLLRPPGAPRYMITGAIGVLLVATAAAVGVRIGPRALLVIFAVAAVGLATNLALMRDGATEFRDGYSAKAKAQFAALELARGEVDPLFDPRGAVANNASPVSSPAGVYFEVVDSYGSPAFTESELERETEDVRHLADQVLAAAVELGLRPVPADGARSCRTVPADPAGAVEFPLPPGGSVLRAEPAAGATVSALRFADASTIELGNLAPGAAAELTVPPDAAARPWRVRVEAPVAVCEAG